MDRQSPVPASRAQQRLWYLDRLAGDAAPYNLQTLLRLEGPLDVEALERAVDRLQQAHDALRARLVYRDGSLLQIVEEYHPQPLPVDEPSDLRLWARHGVSTRFELEVEPPMRARLARLEAQAHVLGLTFHHSAVDGASVGVLLHELLEVYAAIRSGRSPAAPAGLDYADFVVSQERLAAARGRDYEESLDFWRRQLGDLRVLELPSDRPRPPVPSHAGGRVTRTTAPHLRRRVAEFARAERTTPFAIVASALQALLHRLTGTATFGIGVPVAGRSRYELQQLVGLVANTIVLRADVSDDPTFRELVSRTTTTLAESLRHQEVPFDDIVAAVDPVRDTIASPLFQVGLTWEEDAPLTPPAELTRVELLDPEVGGAKHDLVVFPRYGSELVFAAEYSADRLGGENAEAILARLERVLGAALDDPETPISRLPLLDARERRQLVRRALGAAAPRTEATILGLVAAETLHAPAAPAVEAEDEAMTYAELERRANALAHELRARGVLPGDVVGLCHPRGCAGAITGALGVWRTGAALLALEPSYPPARLARMVKETGVRVVVAASDTAAAAAQLGCEILLDSACDLGVPRVEPLTKAQDGAYVIYTSGSTGGPKPVLVPHAGLPNVAQAQRELLGMARGARVLQFSSPTFDAWIFDVVFALANGGTLVLAGATAIAPGAPLAETLRDRHVNVVTLTPSTLAVLPDVELPELRVLCAAGEVCSERLVSRWAPGRAFFNLYGPTETTIWATAARCRPGERVDIGMPLPNAGVHVLDQHLQPVPPGVAGELCISGVGVAYGYLGKPASTAERFVPDPWAARPGARMYRSGDRANRQPQGTVAFLGRLDDQVKIRGFRVDPGEVEQALDALPEVEEVAVVPVERADGDAYLAALVVAASERIDEAALAAALTDQLPTFMVPSVFVMLDRLPRLPSGKIDRNAVRRLRPRRAAASDPPRTRLERRIAAVWAQALDVGEVGVRDNFFDLGGTSLLLARVHVELVEALQRPVTLVDLLRFPTVAALAAALEGSQSLRPARGRERAASRRRSRERGSRTSMPKEER